MVAGGCPPGSDHLARVEDAEWVEGVLDGAVHGHRDRAELALHAVEFEQADAVLAGDGAAHLDRDVDDVGERGLRTCLGGLVAFGVMSSGCRLPSPAWAALAIDDVVAGGDLLDPRQHLGQPRRGAGRRPRPGSGAELLERRERQPPGGEERLGLDGVGRT